MLSYINNFSIFSLSTSSILASVISVAVLTKYSSHITFGAKVSYILIKRKLLGEPQKKIIEFEKFKIAELNDGTKILIPFDESKELEMLDLVAIGKFENGKEVNITQSPGIPYSFSPNDIGLDNIEVFKDYGTKIYEKEEKLGYCDF